MNILLSSAGRRSYLADYFKKSLSGTGKVFASNSIKEATALLHADDYVITPSIYSDSYIDFILQYCSENDIRCIIPLLDIDLPIFARNKEVFAEKGIFVIVSDPEVLEICNDKWKTYTFLKSNGLPTPDTYLSLNEATQAITAGDLSFPVVVKPRWGMGSIGVHIAWDIESLQFYHRLILREIDRSYLKFESALTPDNQVIFQEMIAGQEYGVDIINDLKGKLCCVSVKKKIAMRSGETDAAVTQKVAEIDAIAETLSDKLRHIGNMDMDVLEKNGSFHVLELNARFGGGYPFSHLAGVDLPGAIVAWMKGQQDVSRYFKWNENVTSFKAICPERSHIH